MLRFPKKLRLRSEREFQQVYRSGVYRADKTLVIHAAASTERHPRLGLSVSKKVGNAVVRNRWKRAIREAFRLHQSRIPGGMDIVVRPRKGGICDAGAIQRSLVKLTRQLKQKTQGG